MIFQGALALREHMLEGNPVTALEAMLLFGVQNPNAEFTRLKKEFLLKPSSINMLKVVRRINTYAQLKIPDNLPAIEIVFTQYEISR